MQRVALHDLAQGAGILSENVILGYLKPESGGRRYKTYREMVQVAAQLALTAAACRLLARPLAATLPRSAARSMFWFARCAFAEMLGSHAIMFVVRPPAMKYAGRCVAPAQPAAPVSLVNGRREKMFCCAHSQ